MAMRISSPSKKSGSYAHSSITSNSSGHSRASSTGSVLVKTDSHNLRADASDRIHHSPGKVRRSHSPVKSTWKHPEPSKSQHAIDEDFEELLERFEVSMALRSKLRALAPVVKQDFLRRESELTQSSFGMASSSGSTPSSPRKQTLSSRSGSPERAMTVVDENEVPKSPKKSGGVGFFTSRSRAGSSSDPLSARPGSASGGKKGIGRNSKGANIFGAEASEDGQRGRSTSSNPRMKALRSLSPTRMASNTQTASIYARHLLHTASRSLDVDKLRHLRILLSSESTAWMGDFLFTHRGFEGMLKRIGELVEMEWREDIHDDKALHELLRGMVALGGSETGLVALGSRLFRPYQSQLPPSGLPSAGTLPETAPAAFIGKEDTPPELPLGWELHPPFGPLTGLLLSDKKPGELKTRKLLTDMLDLVLNLKVSPGLNVADSLKELREKRQVSACYEALEAISDPNFALRLLLLLLHNPVQSRSLSMLPFISMSHHPRPFKWYINELLSVARDYFWVFCHSDNRYWDWRSMSETTRKQRGAPSVPGGMTDGVEWEAMNYLAVNVRLINRIASLLTGNAAYHFHAGLFDSGLDKLFDLLRRASQKYYPFTHLALAEYLALATQAGVKLPAGMEMHCEARLSLRLDWAPIQPVTQGSHPSRGGNNNTGVSSVAIASSPAALSPGLRPECLTSLFSAAPAQESTTVPHSSSDAYFDNAPSSNVVDLPSSSSGDHVSSASWFNAKPDSSTAEDLAAAQAFLTQSPSDDAFFNGTLNLGATATAAITSSSPRSPTQPQVKSHSPGSPLQGMPFAPRLPVEWSNAPPPQQRQPSPDRQREKGTYHDEEERHARLAHKATPVLRVDDHARLSAASPTKAQSPTRKAEVSPTKPSAAVGTAKDRIRLWEGRVTMAAQSDSARQR
ncbi:unnamed protein product [Jaminaea pallidilutea]